MIPEIKNNYINWIDGMKISKSDFIATDKANIDFIRDAIATQLNEFNYGLLPIDKNQESISVDLVDNRANSFKIRINVCRAVTIGGCRIEILNTLKDLAITQSIESAEASRNSKSVIYDLIIAVNPFERKPYGQPNPDENPLRHPYAISEYTLQIISSEQVVKGESADFSLTLGRIYLKGDEYVFDTKYIPPCTSVHSHPALINYYRKFGASFNNIEESCTKIVQKVIAKNQTTSLAINVKILSERVLYFISDIFFQYRMITLNKPPVVMLDYFVRLANQIRVVNDCFPEKEKEELLSYFTEWTDLSASNFDSFLNDLVFHDYDHRNIAVSFQKADNFISMVENLFNKLSQLDIIGKRKERDIFVREKSNAEKPPAKKGWSLLE